MISDALITGHILLSDWCFLIALVALVGALVVCVLHRTQSAPQGHVGRSAWLVAPLALVGSALVALGLLVL